MKPADSKLLFHWRSIPTTLRSSTCPTRDVTGAVDRISGRLLSVTKNRVIEFLGIKTGTIDGALAGDGAEFLGSKVLELAAVALGGPQAVEGPQVYRLNRVSSTLISSFES